LKKAFLPTLCFLLLFSCKKHHEAVTTPQPQDSLGTGWTKITGITKGFISDIFFVGSTGYLSCDNAIYRSTNGGDNWQKVYQSNATFQNIGMGSADNAVFVCGDNKKLIFSTTNGGTSFDSTDLGANFSDVFFVSSQVAYAVSGKLWKSVNGGKTWTAIYTFPGSGSTYDILFFISEQIGWATVNDILYKTVNSGVSWTPVTNHGLTTGSRFGYCLFFTDVNNGYYGNGILIKKTTDGGANWSTVFKSGASYGGWQDLHFFTPEIGYLTDYSTVKKTIDGGATWTREVHLTDDNFGIELHFTDANHGWVGTSKGTILKFTK